MTDISTGLLQRCVAERCRAVSAKTVWNEIVVIKEMFKHATRWGYLTINPAEYLQRPKRVKPDIEILSPDELSLFFDHATTHYRLAFELTVYSGLRAGELWGLRWQDIAWETNKILVRQTYSKGRFDTPKSRASIRDIDLPAWLVLELKKWKTAYPANDHDLAFPSPEGRPTNHDNVVKRHFNKALKEAGLRCVSFHSLRHTNASMRIRAGQNIKYLSSQLGHAGIQITLDTYGHLFNDANFSRSQVELLDASFGPVRNPLENTG
jgi:integrase